MSEHAAYTPLVSVVIVNWNGLEDTTLCLEHARHQTYKNIELIVVDNGSTDGSQAYLSKLKDIVYVSLPKNTGFTGGHIAGYKAANGDYILLMNNDAVMDNRYVELALKTIEREENIGAVGGRAYFWNDDNKLFDTTNDFYAYQNINPITGEGIFTKIDSGVVQEVNNVSGSCVLIPRKVIDKVGYLHDPFFAYYEESDLFARMKRAGYRILYNPHLAIWHANGKSSNRKAPTFSYYMMMRNRFRFAVRNFDRWSLLRFLKFYLKMGIVSTLKSFLSKWEPSDNTAYARAFWHNVFHGWRAFIERRTLNRQLPLTYNAQIEKEQTGLSYVVVCTSRQELQNVIDSARVLEVPNEIMAVLDDDIKQHLPPATELPPTFRWCLNRKYTNTPALTLGAICAKNAWLVLSISPLKESTTIGSAFRNKIYELRKHKKLLAYASNARIAANNPKDFFASDLSTTMLIHRQLFIDGGGITAEYDLITNMRLLYLYAMVSKGAYFVSTSQVENISILPESDLGPDDLLIQNYKQRYDEAYGKHRKPHLIEKVFARYYRLEQLRGLIFWLLSPRISARLRLARIRNTILAIGRLDKKALALELKHMRNELLRNNVSITTLRERKLHEKQRLAYLKDHPEETTIFIILRDRIEPLRKLLDWLETERLPRIVLIDNDSALPTLTDFLNTTGYQVLPLGRNPGHTVAWSEGIAQLITPGDFYIVTDPDVIPVTQEQIISDLYDIHKKYPDYLKVGLGLKIDDLPDSFALKQQVIEWESQFWKQQLDADIYEAGVDTTFALYKPYTYTYTLHPSIRLGGKYVARHLPWYANSAKPSDEEIFYRLRADQNVSSWSKDQLPERYVKELAKQRH